MPTRHPLLSECVSYVESRGNPLAMRYEPSYNASPSGIVSAAKYATGGYMSQDTAHMTACTSWGEFQIMGDNLYNLGYTDTIFEFLSDSELQMRYFHLFIGRIGFVDGPFRLLSDTELNNFAKAYNGSLAYANALKEAAAKLQENG